MGKKTQLKKEIFKYLHILNLKNKSMYNQSPLLIKQIYTGRSSTLSQCSDAAGKNKEDNGWNRLQS